MTITSSTGTLLLFLLLEWLIAHALPIPVKHRPQTQLCPVLLPPSSPAVQKT